MIIYSVYKVIFLTLIAQLVTGDILKRWAKWLPYVFAYLICDGTAVYLEHNYVITEFVPFLFFSLGESLLLMALFNVHFTRGFLLHLVILPGYIFPEVLFGLLSRVIFLQTRTVEYLSPLITLLNYIPTYALILLFRKQLKKYIEQILAITPDFTSYIFLVGLNMWWLLIVFYDALFNLGYQENRTIYFLIHVLIVALINIITANIIRLKHSKITDESIHYQLNTKKSMMDDYLAQVHDLRNVEQVLTAYSSSETPKTLIAIMLELKALKAEREGIKVLEAEEIAEMLLETNTSLINSMDFAVIVGIMMDSAIDCVNTHIEVNNEIRVGVSLPELTLFIETQVTEEATQKLQQVFDDNSSCDISKHETNFGLSAAKQLAEKNSAELSLNINGPSARLCLSSKRTSLS
ncbi:MULTISPECIES: GHKL domain-containing protein [unclassified Fusibacter]|uniref:GHKL domain-containing protein n=1 Tax=unclassified Fusibacter TaxID=2624464 RepID=UPI0010136C59|nr:MULTISPECIES: GHKL domain-containing protein [unclassified Fusibacter]MCK8060419.1 GHKL domain-containing protein [Fusibacter sp. A2]NPE20292.1 hypothetical protein [Fusibacter sp. A1]RXV63498.1 hypothetical protein DWB64_00570 [Fusibacter sp. A1]